MELLMTITSLVQVVMGFDLRVDLMYLHQPTVQVRWHPWPKLVQEQVGLCRLVYDGGSGRVLIVWNCIPPYVARGNLHRIESRTTGVGLGILCPATLDWGNANLGCCSEDIDREW